MVRPAQQAQQHENIPEKDNWSVPKSVGSLRTLAQSYKSGSPTNLNKYDQALANEDNGENCSSTEEHMSKITQMGTDEAENRDKSINQVDTQAEENQRDIKEYIVDYFTNKFKKQDVIDDGLLFDSINTQLTEEENNTFTFCPTKEETQAAVFSLGGEKSLRNLLIKYQRASGQTISLDKSKIFMEGVPFTRKIIVKGIFGFKEGLLPETYLGILLIQDRVKKAIGGAHKKKGKWVEWQDAIFSGESCTSQVYPQRQRDMGSNVGVKIIKAPQYGQELGLSKQCWKEVTKAVATLQQIYGLQQFYLHATQYGSLETNSDLKT
ncbi:hypothetical protein GIB67_038999 [Kingdonia uniflora]|uniref:Uncharacterized protein n=1 Tax=Kingdonia uniflora TaxID=39325 RepID=A0A7J7P6M5_9MAGN|nr:hypothetical protein GIB67_038999 [Kingdonia uniflora]